MAKEEGYVSVPVNLIFPEDGQEKDEFMTLSNFGKDLYVLAALKHPEWFHNQRLTYAIVMSKGPVVY